MAFNEYVCVYVNKYIDKYIRVEYHTKSIWVL